MDSMEEEPSRDAVPRTETSGGPKRRRRLRACDFCRNRKIRCDNLPGVCRNCQAYGAQCLITRDGRSIPRSDEQPSQICINRPNARKSSPRNGQQELHVDSVQSKSPIRSPLSSIRSASNVQGHIDHTQSNVVSDENEEPGQPTSPDQTPNFTPLGSTTSRMLESVQGVVTTEEGRFPKNSKFAGKTSPQVFAKSAEELFKYTAPYIDVMAFFSPTMTFSEQLPMRDFEHSPLLDKSTADVCVGHFFDTYHPLFPIFDTKSFHEDYELFYRTGKCSDPAFVSCVFLVIALGSEDQEISHLHFHTTCSLYGNILAHPYLPCVQALILKALYLINTGRDSQALLSIAIAVNIAQSIGLHRSLSIHNHPHEFQFILKEHRLRSCVWWVCYCLDKKLSFELGRPSAINEEDCDADLSDISPVFSLLSTQPAVVGSGQIPNFLLYFIDLCRRLSNISSSLFSISISLSDETPIINLMANADALLVNWRASLPDELVSTSDSVQCKRSKVQAVAASLLNCVYLNAIIAVHRLSLIGQGPPSHSMAAHPNHRIAGSEKICVDAAHTLAHETNNLIAGSKPNTEPRWVSPYSVNAIIAIFISLMKSPRKWSRDVDLALLKSMHHCFRSRDDLFLLGRFEKLISTLIRAVETQAEESQYTCHHDHTAPLQNGLGAHHLRTPAPTDNQDNWNGTSPRSSAGGGVLNLSSSSLEGQLGPPQEGQDMQLGDILSSQWNLWNFQLWPLAPLDQDDTLRMEGQLGS